MKKLIWILSVISLVFFSYGNMASEDCEECTEVISDLNNEATIARKASSHVYGWLQLTLDIPLPVRISSSSPTGE